MDLNNIKSRIDKIDGFYQALKSQEKNLSEEIVLLKKKVELLTKASIVIKHLLDIMVTDEINKMAGLVTYGLKTIFDDQDLAFKPVISKKNDRICIDFKTLNNNIEADFGTYGGSVAVIESFLLRVICMLKMNLARLMLLDETFASVGYEYIPNTSKLIGELSNKLGLDVLLVTHQPEFKNFANKVYRLKDTPNGVLMEKEK